MKATLYISTKAPFYNDISETQKVLLQGVVDNVFSHCTFEDMLSMWRELKTMATLEIHTEKSRLMAIFEELHMVFYKMTGEDFELDTFGIKFEFNEESFVMSAGSGMKALGLDPKAEDWDWSEDQLALYEPNLPEGSNIDTYEVE